MDHDAVLFLVISMLHPPRDPFDENNTAGEYL